MGRPVLNPGELAELLPEFPESEEEVRSPQPRPGEDGTGRSMSPRRDTPCAPPLPPPVFQLWSWPRATSSMASARFLLLFLTRSRLSRRPRRLSCSSDVTRPGTMLPRCTPPDA